MAKIVVEVGQQIDGVTFRLSPKTRAFLSSRGMSLPPASSLFVAQETATDFTQYHGPLWNHVVMILTGLGETELRKLGGFEFVTPTDKKVLFESTTVG